MDPMERDIGDFFIAQGVQALAARAALENSSELTIVEAGVVDRRQREVEGLRIADQQHALARLSMFVEPAMSRIKSLATLVEIDVVALECRQRREIAAVGR